MISITQEMIMHNWKSKETLVSIRCVTYNQEKYISQALDSFIMQKTKFICQQQSIMILFL